MSLGSEWLRVEMRHRVGAALQLDVAFALTAPWTVLFGASGSGKTTVLRTVAGFVRPDFGRVTLQGKTVVDTAARVFVPAHRRGVGSAGQAARLFPGMTVGENLLYGAPRAVGIDEVARLFRLEGLMGKLPRVLSGGEAQRVSVARAVLAAGAGGVLLDEPFNGLDFALRDRLAVELRDWMRGRGVPVLSVTHDVGEAFLLGAEVIRLEEGRVVEQGAVETVLAGERERLLRGLATRARHDLWSRPARHRLLPRQEG